MSLKVSRLNGDAFPVVIEIAAAVEVENVTVPEPDVKVSLFAQLPLVIILLFPVARVPPVMVMVEEALIAPSRV